MSLLAIEGWIFSLLSFGRSLASLDGFLHVALALNLDVLLVVSFQSCVHDRLRQRELIGFTDNLTILVFCLGSNARISLSSQSVFRGRFELYLSWKKIGKRRLCMFVATQLSNIWFFPAEHPFNR